MIRKRFKVTTGDKVFWILVVLSIPAWPIIWPCWLWSKMLGGSGDTWRTMFTTEAERKRAERFR